jgi:hypothetical protein
MVAGGCSNSRRHQDRKSWPGPVLQHRSRQDPEGQGDHDADPDRLEDQRLGDHTSVGATLRGYTVVVPIDATSDATDYEIFIGKYQILNQNSANATNEPLKPRASTLSRSDLIKFK